MGKRKIINIEVKNVVIYARFSSDKQTEQSIEGQMKECYAYAEAHKYNVVGEYIDRALTGTSDNRVDFQKMIEDSNKNLFQGILVYQLDRFARSREDSAHYKSKLKKNGVRVISAKENISEDASGILMEAVLEGMAEYYSVELAQKTIRGLRLTAEKGLTTGGRVALGYKIDENKKYAIDPNTAPVVMQIFEMYADGLSMADITNYLNAKGYKTSQGGVFNKNSLQNILSNRRYLGIYIYMDIEIPGGMPQIIPQDLFNKVANILDKNKSAPAHKRAKAEYLLTTKLFCGYCKEMMVGVSGTSRTGKKHNYYYCNNVIKKKCKKKIVIKDKIEDYAVNQARAFLTDENIDKIAKEVIYVCEKEQANSPIKYLNERLRNFEKQKDNLFTALKECTIDGVRKSIFEELAKVENLINETQVLIAKESVGEISLTYSKIKFFLTRLKNGNINDLKYRKSLISIFINKIYLYDDRITLIINAGDKEATIEKSLLDLIEQADRNYIQEKGYTGNNGSYKQVVGEAKPTGGGGNEPCGKKKDGR